MKNRKYQFDTAIQFIDLHRFPLSIDKNHLIATDFYWLTTPGIKAPKTKNWLHHTWNVALVTVVLFYGAIFLRNYAHQIP